MLQIWPIFISVFLAELGDKTQLATMLFSTEKNLNPWAVFIASAGALVLSSALAVFVGRSLGNYMEFVPLKLIAGCCFIGIGLWTVWDHFQK